MLLWRATTRTQATSSYLMQTPRKTRAKQELHRQQLGWNAKTQSENKSRARTATTTALVSYKLMKSRTRTRTGTGREAYNKIQASKEQDEREHQRRLLSDANATKSNCKNKNNISRGFQGTSHSRTRARTRAVRQKIISDAST